jgi:hypothetical protein
MSMNCHTHRRSSFAALALLFSGLSFFSQLAAAVQIRNPNDDPVFGDAVAGERFGTSVVVDGATAVVGSFEGSDAQGDPSGSVRVFIRQNGGWALQAKLLAPDGRWWDAFGGAVALEGDTLIVGASNYSRDGEPYLGAAYVFERDGSTWTCTQTLFEPVQSAGAFFGSAVVLAGDTLVIGAPQSDVGSSEGAGSVTLFERGAQGWQARQTIAAPNPSHFGMFGAALGFAGDELLVGAYGENLQSGAVYSFARSEQEWTMRQRIAGSEVAASDGFGVSFAADADRLLIGAPAYLQNRNGFVVEWRRENGAWVESRTIRPANEPDLRHFGLHVAHQGSGSWFVGAERRSEGQVISAVDIYTYEAVDDALAPAGQVSVPYVGNAGHGLDALATDGANVFLGLPFSVAATGSDAGEVLVVDQDGSRSILSAGATATREYFGRAVVANSRWLLVAAPGERRQSAQSGAVFAYDLADFQTTPSAAVIDVDGERGDAFGTSLALSGETLLVGSPRDATGSVQAYEYVDAQWQRVARWTSPKPGLDFGAVLAADAASMVVGAPYEASVPEALHGAAYVYERADEVWLPPVRLNAITATDNELFGVSVAIDADVMAVGSLIYGVGPWGEPIASDGFVHVFEKQAAGWTEVAQLARPASPESVGDFGSAVSVAGDTIFASSPALREIHVFQRQAGHWQWTQRIDAPATSSGRFGERVRMIDGDVWISAPDYDSAQRGSLHRFAPSGGTWRLAQSFHAGSSGSVEIFGGDFAVASGIAFIGVPYARGHAAFVRSAGRVDIEVVNVFGSGFEE